MKGSICSVLKMSMVFSVLLLKSASTVHASEVVDAKNNQDMHKNCEQMVSRYFLKTLPTAYQELAQKSSHEKKISGATQRLCQKSVAEATTMDRDTIYLKVNKIEELNEAMIGLTKDYLRELKNKNPLRYNQLQNLLGFYKEGVLYKATKQRFDKANHSFRIEFANQLGLLITNPYYLNKMPANYFVFGELFGKSFLNKTKKHLLKANPSFDQEKMRPNKIIKTVSSDSDLAIEPEELNLEAKNIYSVHLLIAGKTRQTREERKKLGFMDALSRFGHSMIRVIYCPNGFKTEEDKENCLKDEENHLVLNFGGKIDNGKINPLKGFGIISAYPLVMTLASLDSMKEKYNLGENRKLSSFPIKLLDRDYQKTLTNKEDKKLIDRNIEMFIATLRQNLYQAEKYKLVSANCATSIHHFLQTVLIDRKLIHARVQTPISLKNSLIHLHMVNEKLLNKKFEDNIEGDGPYIYASHSVYGDRQLDEISRIALKELTGLSSVMIGQLKHYEKLSTDERMKLANEIMDLSKNFSDDQKMKTYDLFYHLYNYEDILYQRKASDRMKKLSSMLSSKDSTNADVIELQSKQKLFQSKIDELDKQYQSLAGMDAVEDFGIPTLNAKELYNDSDRVNLEERYTDYLKVVVKLTSEELKVEEVLKLNSIMLFAKQMELLSALGYDDVIN